MPIWSFISRGCTPVLMRLCWQCAEAAPALLSLVSPGDSLEADKTTDCRQSWRSCVLIEGHQTAPSSMHLLRTFVCFAG